MFDLPEDRLDLWYTRISGACLPTLSAFTRLRTLILRATHVPRESEAVLRSRLPELGGAGTGPDGVHEGLIW
jgi:hypothetical protein